MSDDDAKTQTEEAEAGAKPAEAEARPAEAKPAEAEPQPAEPKSAPADHEEEGSLLPILLVVGLIVAGLAIGGGVFGGGEEPENQLSAQQLIRLAQNKQSADQAQEKLQLYEQAYQLEPDNPLVVAALGQFLARVEQFDRALPLLESVRDGVTPEAERPEGAFATELHLLIARCYMGLDRFQDAEPSFTAAAESLPAEKDNEPGGIKKLRLDLTRLTIQNTYYRGEVEQAAQLCGDYLAGNPNDSGMHGFRVLLFDELGRPADAIRAVEALVAASPRNLQARDQLLNRRLAEYGFHKTLARYRQDAERTVETEGVEPTPDALALYLLGKLETMHPSTVSQARDTLLSSLEVKEQPWTITALARDAMQRGDVQEARRRINEALVMAPTYPDALLLRPQITRLEGQYEDARAQLEQLGQQTLIYNEILLCYLAEGRYDDALAYAEGLVGELKAADAGRTLLLKPLLALERYDDALALLERIAEPLETPQRFLFDVQRGRILIERGQAAEAQQLLAGLVKQRFEAKAPVGPSISYLAGLAAAFAGDLDAAQASWKQAAQGPEYSPEGFYVFSARRLLGEADWDALRAAAQVNDQNDFLNDAWLIEGLARWIEGDEAGAKEAWDEGLKAGPAYDPAARIMTMAKERG